jgi:hypothetical protein
MRIQMPFQSIDSSEMVQEQIAMVGCCSINFSQNQACISADAITGTGSGYREHRKRVID